MEIEKAFKRLLIKSPFYGLFCLSLPKVTTRETDTLRVIKKGITIELQINPDFWECDPEGHRHTDDEQIAMLEHELAHIANKHMFLIDSFADKRTFNYAADLEVNSYIENLPESALKAERYGLQNGLGTKAYYEHLKQQNQQAPPQQQHKSSSTGAQGNSSGTASRPPEKENDNEEEEGSCPDDSSTPQGNEEEEKESQGDGRNTIDDHSTWDTFKDIPDATRQLMENNINSILKTVAEQVERSCGTIPAEFSEIIQKLREKKPEIFNWKAYFRRILGTIYDINIRSTRRKESKRFEGAAGIQHKKKVSILVAVDTSGSVATKELQEFFNEIDYIYKAGARVTIVECDTQINSVVEYDGKNIPKIVGRGGTSFDPPIEYYIKHKKEYASLIYFTDGYCSLPQKRPSGVVWVITSSGNQSQQYPGKTLFIPKENDK